METEVATKLIEFFSDAVKIIAPALITGVVAHRLGEIQGKYKLKEVEKGNTFKAREKLFDYHRDKIKENTKAISDLTSALAEFSGYSSVDSKDELGSGKYIKGMLKNYLSNLEFSINYAQSDIDQYPSEFAEERKRLSALKKDTSKFISPESPEDVISFCNDLIGAYMGVGHITRLMMEKETLDVFKEYTS
ncbi:hypothetical protein [Teredinibacter turnerae]|uniref:hypothetical protein n=1 Tax=Teredinibacter turnerae TaxID=2426 RepID=UPI0003776E98|nr:hypothetical protein [Teredinibacter turnerae]